MSFYTVVHLSVCPHVCLSVCPCLYWEWGYSSSCSSQGVTLSHLGYLLNANCTYVRICLSDYLFVFLCLSGLIQLIIINIYILVVSIDGLLAYTGSHPQTNLPFLLFHVLFIWCCLWKINSYFLFFVCWTMRFAVSSVCNGFKPVILVHFRQHHLHAVCRCGLLVHDVTRCVASVLGTAAASYSTAGYIYEPCKHSWANPSVFDCTLI